jgi:hypothetical protein
MMVLGYYEIQGLAVKEAHGNTSLLRDARKILKAHPVSCGQTSEVRTISVSLLMH